MKLDTLLSTIILVAFLVTIVMAAGSYVAYKLREGRRPSATRPPIVIGGDSPYFERVEADEDPAESRDGEGAGW